MANDNHEAQRSELVSERRIPSRLGAHSRVMNGMLLCQAESAARQLLDCASPLALSHVRASAPKAAEDCRSPRRSALSRAYPPCDCLVDGRATLLGLTEKGRRSVGADVRRLILIVEFHRSQRLLTSFPTFSRHPLPQGTLCQRSDRVGGAPAIGLRPNGSGEFLNQGLAGARPSDGVAFP